MFAKRFRLMAAVMMAQAVAAEEGQSTGSGAAAGIEMVVTGPYERDGVPLALGEKFTETNPSQARWLVDVAKVARFSSLVQDGDETPTVSGEGGGENAEESTTSTGTTNDQSGETARAAQTIQRSRRS